MSRRRYRNIYTSRHRRRGPSVFKVVLAVIVMAALVFLGYSIIDPLKALFSGKLTSSATNSSSAVSSQTSVTSSESSSSEVSENDVQIHGAYLPKSYLSNSDLLDKFIEQAKSSGINLAVIDLKAEDGIVNYDTSLQQIKGTEAVAQNAPDAAKAAKALSDAGITPAARICAFKDPVAPTVMRGSGVMYKGNHSYNWLDPTNKRWLNPYSDIAQKYIEDLCNEAVSLGYKEIFIDYLTFPTSGNPDSNGYYGENMPSKDQVISDFVTNLQKQVSTAGGKLCVMTTGMAAAGQANTNVGESSDIFALAGDYICPNLNADSFSKDSIQIGTDTITNPSQNTADTVSAVASYLKAQNPDKMSIVVPFIESGDSAKKEIQSLTDAGTGGYILYSKDGNYDFGAIE